MSAGQPVQHEIRIAINYEQTSKSTTLSFFDVGPTPDCQPKDWDLSRTPQDKGVLDYISGRGSMAKVIWWMISEWQYRSKI